MESGGGSHGRMNKEPLDGAEADVEEGGWPGVS